MKTLIDPVCGMTVSDSALRAEGYDDIAFCAPGCRTAFLASPASYPIGTLGDSVAMGEDGSATSHDASQSVDLDDSGSGCCGNCHDVSQTNSV